VIFRLPRLIFHFDLDASGVASNTKWSPHAFADVAPQASAACFVEGKPYNAFRCTIPAAADDSFTANQITFTAGGQPI
jgi:hypothetical protein